MKRKETINMDDKAHDIQIKSQKIKGESAILNAIGIISSKVIAVTVLFSNQIFWKCTVEFFRQTKGF